MRELVRQLFDLAGAETRSRGTQLRVALPPALAPHFGSTPTLQIAFAPDVAAGPDAPTLETVCAALASYHGRRVARGLVRHPAPMVGHGLRAAPGWELRVTGETQREATYSAVLYRLRGHAAERADALITVSVSPDAPPVVAAGVEAFAALLARAGQGATVPHPRAPAADALAATRDAARAYAADWAHAREADTLRALGAGLERLAAHFATAIDEAGPRARATLEARYHRERARLADAHRLTVDVVPVGVVALAVPERAYQLALHAGDVTLATASRVDLAANAPDPPACTACGAASPELAGCLARRHVVCGSCARTCAGCARPFCAACDARPCVTCAGASCAACHARCEGCGQGVCRAHRAACATCGAAGCAGCVARCGGCDALGCARHVRACARCAAVRCTRCLAACPGCGARVCGDDRAACGACGRIHCVACLAQCDERGARVCADDRAAARSATP